MNALFVTFDFAISSSSGGSVVSDRNYKSICNNNKISKTFQYVIKRHNQKKTLFSKFCWIVNDFINLGFGGLNSNHINEIEKMISDNHIDILFLDSSLLGLVAKRIKSFNSNILIVTFFHNHEYYFVKQSIIIERKYLFIFRILFAYLNEKYSCKYSNSIISLNKRDSLSIKNMYKRKVDEIIPVTINDKYTNSNFCDNNSNLYALFVGSYFYANIEGITWFVKNVLPKVDINLIIVGNGMSRLKYDNLNVVVFDYVANLEEFYKNALFVVLPIFSGSGMKVKTAEALMYGKFLVGTSEAFCGYEISENEGVSCNNVDDFIQIINRLKEEGNCFNINSRKLYLNKYSSDVSDNLFNKVICKIGVNKNN